MRYDGRVPEFVPTSRLAAAEIAWIRGFLQGWPLFRLYFESGLEALSRGIDNRALLIGRRRRGMLFSIDFDTVTIRTSAGELDPDEIRMAAATGRRAELHLERAHKEEIEQMCPERVEAVRTLVDYALHGPAAGAAPRPNTEQAASRGRPTVVLDRLEMPPDVSKHFERHLRQTLRRVARRAPSSRSSTPTLRRRCRCRR